MPKGSKILMADDDKMLIDMYKERLTLAGYEVTVCRNGEEALVKVKEVKPDIILLDIMMPKLNGYEALASMKSDPQTKDIPVVMLSALMRDFNREKAVEAGADDYLIKSEAMPADVITKIEQILAKYNKGGAPLPPQTPPPTPPAGVPTPPADLMEQKEEKIVFEPAQTSPPEPPKEEVPEVKLATPSTPAPLPPASPPAVNPPVAPTQNSFNDPSFSPAEKNFFQQENKEKKPVSTALIIILVILSTALVNDLLIYFFVVAKK